MGNKRIYGMQAEICKALAHPLRMEIIHILKKRMLLCRYSGDYRRIEMKSLPASQGNDR